MHGAPFGLMVTHFFVEVVDESLLKVHAMPTCSFEIDIVPMLGYSTNDTHLYTWDLRFLHGVPFGLMATHFFVEVVDESFLKVHAMSTCSFEIDIVTMLGDEETNI